jgi:hypothetical protein
MDRPQRQCLLLNRCSSCCGACTWGWQRPRRGSPLPPSDACLHPLITTCHPSPYNFATAAPQILGLLLLNATISFVEESSADKAIKALAGALAPKCRVRRHAERTHGGWAALANMTWHLARMVSGVECSDLAGAAER